jgi:predicted nucleotidyltransferase
MTMVATIPGLHGSNHSGIHGKVARNPQLGDGFQSDIDILTKLADAYPKENINPKGRSTQLSDIIEKKCK